MTLIVDLQLATDAPDLPDEASFRLWAETACPDAPEGAEVTLRVVDPEEIRALNRDYRGKDRPTNVLSFPFENPPGVTLPLLGDIILCAEVIASEAAEQNKPLMHHWAHMVIHGMLHLQGHDHVLDEDAEIMENLERQLLARLNIPDPYQDR